MVMPIPVASTLTQLDIEWVTKATHWRVTFVSGEAEWSAGVAQSATAAVCTGSVSQHSASFCVLKQRVTTVLLACTEKTRRRMLTPSDQLWMAHTSADSTAT